MLVSHSDDVTTDSHVKQLELRIAELEQENAKKDLQIEALKKKIEEQENKFAVLKQYEQELHDQQGLMKDKSVQEMCLLLELQHRELIRQQLKQVEETITTSKCQQPSTRMIIINPGSAQSLNSATSLLNSSQTVVCNSLGGNVTIPAFNTSNNHQTEDLTLDLECSSENEPVQIKDESEETEIEGAENSELLNTVNQSILERTFPDSLDSDRLQIESTDADKHSDEPLHKKRKNSENVELQNL